MKKELTPRQLILKSRFYRFFGLIFAAVGLFIFIFIFAYSFKGDVFLATKEPMAIMIVIIPFLPACILSWIGGLAEKKAITMLEKTANSS
ncbi:MAG: hypothetical protein AAF569_07480 [Pseudomonadota bacterium]